MAVYSLVINERPQFNSMNNIKSNRGFTLVEIMTVIAIIGVLAAVAMASFVGQRRVAERNICQANLKQIQIVVNTWSLDTGAGLSAAVTKEALVPNYIKVWPKEGTTDYPVPANINTRPTCPNISVHPDHTI